MAELKGIVERGWTPPSGSTEDSNERKEGELGQDDNGDDDDADDDLDFSDFGKKTN